MCHQRLEFGPEDKLPIVEIGVVQGLDAETVAYQKQGLLIAVP